MTGFRVRIPLAVPEDLRQAGRDVTANALAEYLPGCDSEVVIEPNHGLVVRLTFQASTAAAAKRKGAYWMARVSERSKAFTYIPDGRSLALMEVEPCPK